jgi:thioredoxin-like negative regulator of GroEL
VSRKGPDLRARRLGVLVLILVVLGIAYASTGRWREALMRDSARARAIISETERMRHRDEQIDELERHLDERPGDVDLRLEVAQARWKQQGASGALRILDGAPDVHADARIERMRAQCWRQLNREDHALGGLTAAIKRFPSEPDLRADRALLYVLLAWHDDAEAEIRAAEQGGSRETFMARATLARAKGDLGSARAILEAARGERPEDPEIVRQLAAVADSSGDYRGSAELLDSLPPEEEARTDRLAAAAALFRAGEVEEALKRAEAGLRAAPGEPRGRLLRARCLNKQGDAEGAFRELRALRQDLRGYSAAAFELAQMYRARGDGASADTLMLEYREAQERREQLRKAGDRLIRNGESAGAHLEVGRLCVERGRWGRAIVELTRALELDPAAPGAAKLLQEAEAAAMSAQSPKLKVDPVEGD